MGKHRAAVLVCTVALAGCGVGMTGTYLADVEQVSTPEHVDPGYSLEEVRQKLQQSPRTIELRPGGEFETRDGGRVVWQGDWRREGETLILRTETVNGIDVGEALQSDDKYTLRDGAIIDDGTYGAYGLRLVYRRQ